MLSYFVVQHTPEIGVRIGLGALPLDVLSLVVVKRNEAGSGGVGVGLAGSFGLDAIDERACCFGVSPTDPLRSR